MSSRLSWVVLGRAVAVAALPLMMGCGHGAPATGTIGAIVPNDLVDQDGRAFGSAELAGHVWIVALMFTRCSMACPLMAARMAHVQSLLPEHAPAIRLLSVSVDPADDTPPVIAAYGVRFHRDPTRWTFVTGSTEPTLRSVTEGYARAEGDAHPFDHGSTLALVDERGRVRGYYGKDDASLAQLLTDADQLAASR